MHVVGLPPWSASRQRGSVTVLAASLMFLAAVLCLVAVDVMRALQARTRAQVAADAAALAAAQELAVPRGSTPQQAAADYAARNGGALVSCTCAAGATEALVEVQVGVHLVFLGPDRTLTAWARAVVGQTPAAAQGRAIPYPAPDGRSGQGQEIPPPGSFPWGGGLHGPVGAVAPRPRGPPTLSLPPQSARCRGVEMANRMIGLWETATGMSTARSPLA